MQFDKGDEKLVCRGYIPLPSGDGRPSSRSFPFGERIFFGRGVPNVEAASTGTGWSSRSVEVVSSCDSSVKTQIWNDAWLTGVR